MKIKWLDITKFLLLLLPTIVMLVLLIDLFPYTGLGRIASVPSTIIINSLIIWLYLAIKKKNFWIKYVGGLLTLIITLTITVIGHPQEFKPSVLVQSQDAIRAIKEMDNVTRNDLYVSGSHNSARYVVALFKYRDEILKDGTYQLYEKENVYFRNYTIKDLSEISSKLIGYHKVMWWYLNNERLFNGVW
ncbi:hypothetical protein BBD41_22860 [Paenibacillus ihbetae]|uniref:Uncharacterized protein n=1 Tax=Paenibacillus ihbetae TaxID=1870820 RepID=A0A1B2E5E8_9BACL|nr:hypothetical protein [Paenibacillus ihbetae]ANY75183.1 hypothetical protein BBD41_22860 [Paenibacillus ihbetae]